MDLCRLTYTFKLIKIACLTACFYHLKNYKKINKVNIKIRALKYLRHINFEIILNLEGQINLLQTDR